MHVFEHAIKYLWWRKLKGILQKYTNWSANSIFTGTWSTALLQSSSLVSLLVLAFTGAWVMQLSNAIWVIIWANIWTTVSSLVIAWIWFGDFKIAAFALPIIAIWWCALIFVKDKKKIAWAKLLVWFWLLFLWLDFMKESVDAIKATFDLEAYKHLSLWAFGLLWAVVTAVIQSSSAVWVMTLAALSSGIITFPASIAIVMWSNIWTTVTSVIASLWWEPIKRQVALSQVLFNVISWIIWVVFFWWYIWLTLDVLWFRDNPVMWNAVLNAIFNISTAVLFGFFLVPFTRLIQRIVKIKKNDTQALRITQIPETNDEAFSQAALIALEEDTKTLIDQAMHYNTYLLGLTQDHIKEGTEAYTAIPKNLEDRNKEYHVSLYDKAKDTGNILLSHLLKLKELPMSDDAAQTTSSIDKTIHAVFRSLKSTKNIYHDVQELKGTTDKKLQELYKTLFIHVTWVYQHVATITDRTYWSENFVKLTAAATELSAFHTAFIEQLSAFTSSKEMELSTLINIDHYTHQSAQMLVQAVQHAYLTHSEDASFEQLTK